MTGDYWEERKARFGFGPVPLHRPPAAPIITGDNPAYAAAALRDEAAQVANASEGTRNDTLNTAAFNLASFVTAGALDRTTVVDTLTFAAQSAGLSPVETAATIRSGFAGAEAKVGAREIPAPRVEVIETKLNGHASNEVPQVDTGRVITWTLGSDLVMGIPTWAWHYAGRGRIQRGTLALFAGRPGAGKSTAARWFAAQATLGKLEGCWEGKPHHVAYIAAEESLRYVVGPGLVAAGADMSRIHFPRVTRDGEDVALLGALDEAQLLQYCRERNITVIVIDPLMSTVTAQADLNRNNEIRGQIAPWARIADAIDGISMGVVHLRKNTSGDVVAAITGSSAFGEIARAIFGFAKNVENETRVMSQHKNSTGYEDLSLTYQIASVPVTVGGEVTEIGTFTITGTSEITVEDILSDAGGQGGGGGAVLECQRWLADYLSVEGPIASREAKLTAQKDGGWSHATVERAASKLRIDIESRGFPRRTYWSLPVTSSHLKESS